MEHVILESGSWVVVEVSDYPDRNMKMMTVCDADGRNHKTYVVPRNTCVNVHDRVRVPLEQVIPNMDLSAPSHTD